MNKLKLSKFITFLLIFAFLLIPTKIPNRKTYASSEELKISSKAAILVDYESDLLAKKQEFENAFRSELKQKYLAQIDKYLKDFEGYFCNIGFMKTVDRGTAAKERAMKFAKSYKINSKADAEKACEELKIFLPKLGLTEDGGREAINYLLDKGEKSENKSGVFGLFKK